MISDPINKQVIDILVSRRKDKLIEYFNSWSKEQLQQIKHFSMDMWGPYKSVAKTVDVENTTDKFHLVALMNKALKLENKNKKL